MIVCAAVIGQQVSQPSRLISHELTPFSIITSHLVSV